MTAANLSSEQVRRALLDQNYMPRASRRGDDLPPSFSTLGMHEASRAIVGRFTNQHRHSGSSRSLPGYSMAEARVAHFRWNPRRIEIPHPVAYSNLVETISDNWETGIAPRLDSSVSQFTVRQHEDGRIASMESSRPPLRPGVGSRFRVRTDIASFYDSIYTHAIPWALMGKSAAKANRSNDHPANQLDSALRFARRGETTGISVGPGTSLIIAELLLAPVDEKLSSFRFERFLDDYIAYTTTETEAEAFIRNLDSELREYGLRLSGSKTSIEVLPQPDEPSWIRELRRASQDRPGELLDRAIELAQADSFASAVRWVVSRLRKQLPHLTRKETGLVIDRMAELSYAHPHITSALVEFALASGYQMDERDLNALIQKHVSDAQTSAVCWLLHFAWSRGNAIQLQSWEAVASARDPLTTALLLRAPSLHPGGNRDLLLKSVVQASDDYSGDEAWPSRYVAYLEGREDAHSPGFEELRNAGVALLREPLPADFEFPDMLEVDGDEDVFDDSWESLGLSG